MSTPNNDLEVPLGASMCTREQGARMLNRKLTEHQPAVASVQGASPQGNEGNLKQSLGKASYARKSIQGTNSKKATHGKLLKESY